MTTDDSESLARLRRLAYGRAHTPEELAAAAAAREALANAEAAAREPDAAEPEPEPEPPAAPGVEETTEPVGARRGWVVPAVIALVIGAFIGGAGATLAGGPPTAEPAPTPTFVPGSSALPEGSTVVVSGNAALESGPGMSTGAYRWFQDAQADADLYTGDDAVIGSLDVDMTSVRLVHESGGAKVWVAQGIDGRLCVLVKPATTSASGGACVEYVDFDQYGITVRVPGANGQIVAMWDGQAVTVSAGAP